MNIPTTATITHTRATDGRPSSTAAARPVPESWMSWDPPRGAEGWMSWDPPRA